MSLPEIRFQDIRPHDNSRNIGFEELCCQLAALENRAPGAIFTRKGRGGDAGVECFLRLGGKEKGWQAKYVFAWDASLKKQLDESIRTALDKHPDLDEYIVCLPFDFPDSRSGKGTTALGHWNKWVKTWVDTAKAEGRSIEICLWNASAISERLSRDDSAYTGRLLYWFDQEALTKKWMESQFAKAKSALGSRYVPTSNVELPIRRDFLTFVRDPSELSEIAAWSRSLQERVYSAAHAAERAEPVHGEVRATQLHASLTPLIESLSLQLDLDQPIALTEWENAAKLAAEVARATLGWSYSLPDPEDRYNGSSPVNWVRHEVHRLLGTIDEILDACKSTRWQLANMDQLLLTGEAGIGKSHLLADVVAHQIERGAPAIMMLGSMFNDSEPWRQIMAQHDLPTSMQAKHFLAALDAAAEASGMRAIICIDAINERHGLEIWPARLAACLKEVESFPRVVICVSCRTTFLPYVLPDNLCEISLPRIEHQGFGGTAGEAAKVYLDMRGIVRPGAPNLLPEFNNPLFLKTCCDYLEKEGKKEIPKGLQGVSSIFAFYLSAVAQSLNRRMRLDQRQNLVIRAVQRFVEILADEESGSLEVSRTVELFDAVYHSRGKFEDSLLSQLECEGLLTVEPVPDVDGEFSEVVRFTFERFSDYQIAKHLLARNVSGDDPAVAFAAGAPLHEFVCGSKKHHHAGVIEALAVQLPQQFGRELPDLLPPESVKWAVKQAFEKSLLWRDQSCFTQRTFDLVSSHLGSERVKELLIQIATEPRNMFNARFLHARLSALPMPLRDAKWSVYIAGQADDADTPVGTLISWAWNQGMDLIEDDRAELTAIALTWLFSTSARVIRDPATKALSCVLSSRPSLCAALIKHFSAVDDLYIKERLFAAIYGAVLQGAAQDGVGDLARAVYEEVFAEGRPPTNILLRDHAAGIIKFAKLRGLIPESFDTSRVEPPYQSAWPIEFVPDSILEDFKQDYGRGSFHDDIVSSTSTHGDFGAYIIRPLVCHFSALTRDKRVVKRGELFAGWFERFWDGASLEQKEAWTLYFEAAADAKGEVRYGESPEKIRLEAAERDFRELLAADKWEEFRVSARDFFIYSLFSPRALETKATFNAGWANRWICKRAHDLGWDPKSFEKFERYRARSSDRYDHRIERIGKKYQWLALHEIAARMDDNLALVGNEYSDEDDDEDQAVAGAYQLGLRDIDPSLVVRRTYYDGWKQWPKTWWSPIEERFKSMSPRERMAWKDSPTNVPNDRTMIEVVSPDDRRSWLVLHSHRDWRNNEIVNGRPAQDRSSWVRLDCVVVRKDDASKLVGSLIGRSMINSDNLPKIALSGGQYLGEYPWHSSCSVFEDWWGEDSWRSMPVPTRPTVADYQCERGGYDYSIEQTVSVQLPAPWLMSSMGLRLIDGRKLSFANSKGRVMFFDPSVCHPGPQAALVDRDAFLAMLEAEGLEAIWIIAGEKAIYSGEDAGRGWGGSHAHSFIYRFADGELKCQKRFDRSEPSQEQLERYLGSEQKL